MNIIPFWKKMAACLAASKYSNACWGLVNTAFKTKSLILLFLVLAAFACEEKPKDTLFQSIDPAKSGVQFSNDLTDTENFNIIDYLYFYNGGGVGVADFNNDGLPDLYFSANQKPNKLYLNKGNFEFEDITERAGVAALGDWKTGVSIVDINADGLQDIYVCQLGNYKGITGKNRLYINNGDLTFTERAEEYGLDFSGFSTHAAFFDYDNDGDLDAYLLNHSVHTTRTNGRSNLRNEVDSLAGDRLLRNDSQKFVDVTAAAGIYSSAIGYGLAIGLSDVNQDGFTDIYISNDFHENDYMYINNGDGTFTESIQTLIQHTSRSSMGNDVADFNNDGWPDIISLDMLPADEVILKSSSGDDPYDIYQLKLSFGYGKQFARNTLQLNMGGGNFSEVGLLAGVSSTDWSWSSLFADFDNDGYKDLFISNGIVKRPNDMDYFRFISDNNVKGGLVDNPQLTDADLINQMPEGKVANYFFKNRGDLTFQDYSSMWAAPVPTFSNGSAYADLDLDGDLDLVINNINDPATMLKNTTIDDGKVGTPNYLSISLEGTGGNKFGIGAKVHVYSKLGSQYFEMFTTRGYQSAVEPKITVGLSSEKLVDSIVVMWPDGNREAILSPDINKLLVVKQKQPFIDSFLSKSNFDRKWVELDTTILTFKHIENTFVDYNTQFLIPHMMSHEGPKMAVGDVNGDGLSDIYLTGSTNSGGRIYFQTDNGTFIYSEQSSIRIDLFSEETDAEFFDADGDGDLDLYIVTGGNEFGTGSLQLRDKLLFNDGQGNFSYDLEALPNYLAHGSVVCPADFDNDGDIDLFVGGHVVAGNYGLRAESALLINDGKGKFTNATFSLAPSLAGAGMVTSALATDVDNDGWQDLLIVGEWMPLTLYLNKGGKLVPTQIPEFEYTEGWWNTIAAQDIDGDGDLDFFVGNLGTNSKLKPSVAAPVSMYLKDFDGNQSLDQIITYISNGREYPAASRDELINQMPKLKKNFVLHKDFAGKSVSEIFSDEILAESGKLVAYEFRSMYVENLGTGKFRLQPLPDLAQLAPIYAFEFIDINKDGHLDVIAGGNKDGVSPYFGSYDAGKGLIMTGNGQGDFESVWPYQSGFLAGGDIRDIKKLILKDQLIFIISRNSNTPLTFRITE
jgi:hypothetical protein